MKIEELKEGIRNISEPRRTGYGNIRHKLEDIIIIGLCTIICGGEDFADMEMFGKSRQEYLSKFLELPNGIPDSDTFRRVFEKLNPSELSSCLINWISCERTKRGTVAIDGKTICESGNGKHKAYHVISAFVAENQLTLGELAVEEKTNEITTVPELLDLSVLVLNDKRRRSSITVVNGVCFEFGKSLISLTLDLEIHYKNTFCHCLYLLFSAILLYCIKFCIIIATYFYSFVNT
ncbi:MAG: ISAs1 family transposase [Ruminococcus albus]|jgi:hypothetical protein|nr:ISAs1 family transposase [Ruminococcus albus]